MTDTVEAMARALERARGWVVVCTESARARKDLKALDEALAAYRASPDELSEEEVEVAAPSGLSLSG